MLTWNEQELPQKQRTKHVHGLHPYMGKFIPQLVSHFLERQLKDCKCILDPFAGSGTAIIESNLHNKNSIGIDISKFNTILCNVKIAKYDLQILGNEISDIFEKTQNISDTFTSESKYLNDWYHKEAITSLLTFKSLIKNYTYQDVLKIILSRAARSSRMVPHYEVDFPQTPQNIPYFCHKHFRTCYPTKNAIGFLKRYCKDTFLRLSQFSSIRNNIYSKVFHADARTFKFGKNQIDGVITSPPYVGLIDYHAQHQYAYELLDLEQNSQSEIGRKSKGTTKKAVKEYAYDITQVFTNIVDKCPNLKNIVIIINDKFDIYDTILSDAGLSIEQRMQRSVDRRSGRRGKSYYEDVILCTIDR